MFCELMMLFPVVTDNFQEVLLLLFILCEESIVVSHELDKSLTVVIDTFHTSQQFPISYILWHLWPNSWWNFQEAMINFKDLKWQDTFWPNEILKRHQYIFGMIS